jgi:hypothetical protein
VPGTALLLARAFLYVSLPITWFPCGHAAAPRRREPRTLFTRPRTKFARGMRQVLRGLGRQPNPCAAHHRRIVCSVVRKNLAASRVPTSSESGFLAIGPLAFSRCSNCVRYIAPLGRDCLVQKTLIGQMRISRGGPFAAAALGLSAPVQTPL